MDLELHTDAAAFLSAAGHHLARQPVLATVVATVAERAVRAVADGIEQDPRDWFAVACNAAGEVVGVAMRTAPFGVRPLFVLPMPDEAALALARTLHEREEEVSAANGALPAVRVFAEEAARLAGGTVEVSQHTRLLVLGALREPRPTQGRLRAAVPDDLPVTADWFEAFMHDADEQAGRPPGSSAHERPSKADLRRRIDLGCVWFWEDGSGDVVHMTVVNPPAYGVSRIGPVYTPHEERGRGWASAAVAEVSRRIREDGVRACLFTDQANPTSNRIYEALGYRRVVDMANLRIEGRPDVRTAEPLASVDSAVR